MPNVFGSKHGHILDHWWRKRGNPPLKHVNEPPLWQPTTPPHLPAAKRDTRPLSLGPRRERSTGEIQVEQLAMLDDIGIAPTGRMPTVHMTAPVPKACPEPEGPSPFFRYGCATNIPHQLLYGAVIECYKRLKKFPRKLIVSPERRAELVIANPVVTGQVWSCCYRFPYRDGFVEIPVDSEIPKELALAIEYVPRDYVYVIYAPLSRSDQR